MELVDGAVWAVSFDPHTATLHGDALPVIPAGVIGTVRSGSMGFQVSSTGTLVYLPADFDLKLTVSVGRDGSESILGLPAHRYANPRISPDGRLLVVENEGTSIETLDLQRGTRAKLVAGAMGTSFPTWTVDSKTVVFRRFNVLFWVAADGSGRMGLVPGGVINDYPSSPGPNPDSIIGVRINPDTSGDVYLFSVSGKSEPTHLIQTPAYEGGAQLSFDGRWLLYQSNESGQPEIYVRHYPALDRRWQVSDGGGVQPRWGPADREIYYRSGSRMMVVKFDPSNAEPVLGKPMLLFTGDYDYGQGLSIANYDVTRDGRFIMLRRESHASSLRVVINWTDELQRILASGGVR